MATLEELAVEQKDKRALAKIEREQLPAGLSMDWRNSDIVAMAKIIAANPYGEDRITGEQLVYTPAQAAAIAWTCKDLGLSPFRSHVWYNTKTNKVELTVEGQLEVARNRGFNLGPPQFIRKARPFKPLGSEQVKKVNDLKAAGFTEDIGYTVEIEIQGFKNTAKYDAWLSSWYMARNPNWKERPEEMLQIRALGHALEMITGCGLSSNPIANDEAQAEIAPTKITATPVEFVPAVISTKEEK